MGGFGTIAPGARTTPFQHAGYFRRRWLMHHASPVLPYGPLTLLAPCTLPAWNTARGQQPRRSSADSDGLPPSHSIRTSTRRLHARAQPLLAFAAESSAPAQPGLKLHQAPCPTHPASLVHRKSGRTCAARTRTRTGPVPELHLQGPHPATTRPCTARSGIRGQELCTSPA